MSLMNALWPWFGELGDPIEDGKKAQLEQSRTFKMGVDDLREAKIGDKVILEKPKTILYGRTSREFGSIEGEFSVVEIDGKKLLDDK